MKAPDDGLTRSYSDAAAQFTRKVQFLPSDWSLTRGTSATMERRHGSNDLHRDLESLVRGR